MNPIYPIQTFIESRCTQLNISHQELIIRMGYSNTSVGLKRLQQLFDANLKSAVGVIDKLPEVLEVDVALVEQAINDTKKQLELEAKERYRQAEEEYRANFKPNFVIRTGLNGRPKTIFLAAVTNATRYVSAQFPAELTEQQYIGHAMPFLEENKENIQHFFFPPECIAINYTPDHADIFSLTGEKIAQLTESVRIGRTYLALKNVGLRNNEKNRHNIQGYGLH